MKLISKISFLGIVLLFASLLDSTSLAAVNSSENVDNTTLLAGKGTSSYDSLMRQGYAAARRRNYTAARNYFQQALGHRPGDKYATRAIANMNRYLARRNSSRIAYSRTRTGRRAVGGTRGGCFDVESEQARQLIIPLIPSDADGVTTTAEYPSFLFYVPQIPKVTSLELVVRDDKTFEKLQTVALTPNKQSGIVRANLTSQTGKPLALNKEYTWVFSVICGNNSRDTDWALEGKVKRVQPNENLNLDLETAAPQEQVEIYVENKLWENALRTVADLRRQNPNDAEIKQYWQELLKSVDFQNEVIQAPLLQ
ncbi:DUF928 domain-containing protein [Halotia branconii]|uniref:DUF928 domain-containing protein n=1 Tax=Halotia branconii CENA392 TaxID=1539056 RepID=A0AAJ6NPK6_9CYAN|nr:DUF928 domain-containing protein [Halotia branconii]WGV24218.1 DUF928 domain-containing protein [Halotia branconii CENA392]